jgi:hypothetical protein
MITTQWNFEKITDAYYTEQVQPTGESIQPVGRDLLRVTTDCDTYEVLNGNFSQENPTMQLFGYFGVKPSTFESELPGQQLPVAVNQLGQKHIANVVFQNGRWCLTKREWIETDDEDA